MEGVFQLETVHELNQHAERLLAALYSVSQELSSDEFRFLSQSEAKNWIKGKAKDPKLTAVLTAEKVQKWGRALRHPFAVLQHVRAWQAAALEALLQVQSVSGDWDLSWNYVYGFPTIQLFSNYVKVHIFLTTIPNLTVPVQLYMRCLSYFGRQDQNADGLVNFLKSRETLKACESELQKLEHHLSSAFKSLLPTLQLCLGLASTFPWKLLSLVERPKPLLPADIFFKDSYVCLMHLGEICDAYLLFGVMFMQYLATDPVYGEAFAMMASYCLVIHLYGQTNIDLRNLFNTVKKLKDKKIDYDASFLESAESNFPRQKSSQGYCRRKLTTIIKEYIAACKVDASIVCTKHAIAFGILGFADFELQLAFNLKKSKPQLDPFVAGEVSELMYWFVNLVALMTKMIPDLQRFFLFNLREFDSNFLDTLAHSYVIPQSIYNKIATLVSALRTVNIEDFDNGEDLDLYPCISMVGSIASAFNKFGQSRGITHLSQLLQLVSGCGFRLSMFQDTFGEILRHSHIHRYWQYLKLFGDLASESTDMNSKFNVFGIHMTHFYGMDEVAVGEIPQLSTEIKTAYGASIGQTLNTIFTWFKELQERCFNDMGRKDHSWCNPTHPENSERLSDPSDFLLQKITFTLAATQEIGVINVLGEEHNVFQEVSSKIGTIMTNLFFQEEARPPMELTKKIQAARWALQLVCSACNFPFHQTVWANLQALSTSNQQDSLGPFGAGYAKKYVELARTVLKDAYYSNAQEMFVPAKERQEGQSVVYNYMSLPALHALHDLIGTNGCLVITKRLAQLAGELMQPLTKLLLQVMQNPNSYRDGACQFSEAEKIINALGHVSAVIKLREMFRPFVGSQGIPSKPEFDLDLVVPMQEAGVVDLISDNTLISVLGALLASSYWDHFNYDVAHDAIVGNAHIWAHTFDTWIGAARQADKADKTVLFYRLLFEKCLLSIDRCSKGKDKHAMSLYILVDHIVTDSKFTDYSALEPYVAYHLIRSLYTAKLSKYAHSK